MIAIPYGKGHLDVAFPYNGLLTSRVDELKSDRTGRELVEEAVQSAERARLLRTCMRELHEDYREALFLVYFEGLSHAETAAVMGKREKQVADLIYRGKIALRKRLEQEGITDAYNG